MQPAAHSVAPVWHRLQTEDVVQLLNVNLQSGLASDEVKRRVFDNLTKFIIWTLPTNTGEALILLSAIFLGTALPALPVQLLWINMSTAILLGLMLAFEPAGRATPVYARPIDESPFPQRAARCRLVALCERRGLAAYLSVELEKWLRVRSGEE